MISTVPARRRAVLALGVAVVVGLAACGGDNKSEGGGGYRTTAATVAPSPTTAAQGVTMQAISPERCNQNKAAGKITFLTSFDFSAAASILDVTVAKQKGYFATMCLDVDLKAGFSTTNYPLVAAGQAQMSSAGSFTEIANYAKDGAQFVGVVDYGKIPIEALLVRDDGKIAAVADLKGKTIGVKGDIPPSIVAMLSKAGLQRGVDYKEVQLDGFDPKAHLQQAIDALPVYKSNEPGQLDAAGIKYKLFDPAQMGIPGSFGVIYTTPDFLAKHPTAVQDFARASLRGYEDAVADPAGAVKIAIDKINAAGNQAFLTEAGETYRWQQESKAVKDGTPAGQGVGLVDPNLVKAEFDAYAAAKVFPNGEPDPTKVEAATVATPLYDATTKLIWPAS
jgi:NitT/TauT family transport system substrate-binding protein